VEKSCRSALSPATCTDPRPEGQTQSCSSYWASEQTGEPPALRGPLPTTVAARYFAESPRIRSAGTRKIWGGHLRRLERRYPDKRLNEYTARTCATFLLFDPDGTPTTRAHRTIVAQRAALRSSFGWAAYATVIEHDPSPALTRLVNVKPTAVRSHFWLNDDEIEALFTACYDDPCELLGRRDALASASECSADYGSPKSQRCAGAS
jgi:hypothetical protein